MSSTMASSSGDVNESAAASASSDVKETADVAASTSSDVKETAPASAPDELEAAAAADYFEAAFQYVQATRAKAKQSHTGLMAQQCELPAMTAKAAPCCTAPPSEPSESYSGSEDESRDSRCGAPTSEPSESDARPQTGHTQAMPQSECSTGKPQT